MHVVIMGCGRVGTALAKQLLGAGHTVAVVDVNPSSFSRLGPAREGLTTVAGVGFDQDTLIEAGIEHAGGFAAVSSGDNSNIIAARVARETFGVQRVVTRIYDPRRAEVYERLGIPAVATVTWTADQVLRRLVPEEALTAWTDPSGQVVLAQVQVHPGWVGRKLRDMQDETDCRVALLTRLGQGMVPSRGTVLQDGDLVHVTVLSSRRAEIERALKTAPPKEGH